MRKILGFSGLVTLIGALLSLLIELSASHLHSHSHEIFLSLDDGVPPINGFGLNSYTKVGATEMECHKGMIPEPASITCQVSEIRIDHTSEGTHSGELGPFVHRTCSTSVKCSSSKLDEFIKREKALDEELTNKDETIMYLNKALWKEGYVCDITNLITDPLRTDGAEAKLTEAVIRACKAEARMEEIGTLLRKTELRSCRAEQKLAEAQAKAEKAKVQFKEAKLGETEQKLAQDQARAQKVDMRWKETDSKLSDAADKLKEKEEKLTDTGLKFCEAEKKLAEVQARAEKTKLTLMKTMEKLTEADKSSCNLEARLKETEGKLKELSKTAEIAVVALNETAAKAKKSEGMLQSFSLENLSFRIL